MTTSQWQPDLLSISYSLANVYMPEWSCKMDSVWYMYRSLMTVEVASNVWYVPKSGLKVYQMLSWLTKNFTSICQYLSAVTKCCRFHVPSYEISLTLLAPFSTEVTHLNMLFMLELACNASCAGHLKIKKNTCTNKPTWTVNLLARWSQAIRWHLEYWAHGLKWIFLPSR